MDISSSLSLASPIKLFHKGRPPPPGPLSLKTDPERDPAGEKLGSLVIGTCFLQFAGERA